MSLAIVGSRHHGTANDYAIVKRLTDEFIQDKEIHTIISGGAQGIDSLAVKYARERNLKIIVYQAEWALYGKSAGPKRNELIVQACDFLIAFPSKLYPSVGTEDSIKKALKKFGIDSKYISVHSI